MGRQTMLCFQHALYVVLFLVFGNSNAYSNHLLSQLREFELYNLDSAYVEFDQRISKGIQNNDTLSYINVIQLQSKIAKYKGYYNEAYELHWLLLDLCDSTQYPAYVARTYVDLGYMYGTYNQHALSREYQEKALSINRSLVKENKLPTSELTHNYYSLASYYKTMGEYDTALLYLDSCVFINSRHKIHNANSGFVNGEKGNCYLQMGQLDLAEEYLLMSLSSLVKQASKEPFYCNVNVYLGHLYYELKEYSKAEQYFINTIHIADSMKIGNFIKQDAYEMLATLNEQKGDYKSAFTYQGLYKSVSDSLFGVLNTQNSSLFQIRNTYREQHQQMTLQVNRQELTVLRQERSLSTLRLGLMAIAGAVLIGSMLVYFFYQKKKSVRLLEFNANVIEMKQKELTSSSLKLIETSELINQFKKDIDEFKGDTIPRSRLTSFVHSINVNSKHNWEEFELRFTAVNETFYENLLAQYPMLSANDLKLCAMIKLGLTSKDMSALMGISLKSVHTARYRMRKKMELDAEVDLYQFICTL